ncbi:hypothetical protein RS9916_31952 [Synechococcus sp. RS9916]|nr:hypothetical protein RS9916_31952 [Synechococcus sp. RS9916]
MIQLVGMVALVRMGGSRGGSASLSCEASGWARAGRVSFPWIGTPCSSWVSWLAVASPSTWAQ